MKISAYHYAKALYEATREKERGEVDRCVLDFSNLLIKNNQTKLTSEIIKKFETIWNREKNIIEAEVTSKDELEKESVKKIEAFIKEKYHAREVVLRRKADKNILGGIILKAGDEVWDGSVRRQLDELKKRLVNTR